MAGEGEGHHVIRRLFLPVRAEQVVRVLWVMTVGAVLLAWVPVFRHSFVRIHHLCQEPNCSNGQLNARAASALHAVGIPIQAFAAWDDLLVLLSIAVFCAVGGAIIRHRPKDRMGILAGFTLVLFGGITFGLGSPLDVIRVEGPTWGPPVNVLALLGSIGITLFVFLFPDGRFVPRWIAIGAIASGLQDIPSYLAPGSALDSQDGAANSVLSIIWLGGLLLMVGAQVYRYRTVSGPTERQQTKWVVLGIASALMSFLGLILMTGLVPLVSETGGLFLVFDSVFRLVMLPIPIGIGFAMLRYRLWDVDLFINRALVYVSLTVTTVGLYVGGVIGLQALFRAVTGQSSDLAIAIVTLGVAALFNPWRHRLQGFIDRRFYRRKYDAARVLAAFSTRLRDEVDLDQLSADLLSAAHETLQPRVLALWLPGGER